MATPRSAAGEQQAEEAGMVNAVQESSHPSSLHFANPSVALPQADTTSSLPAVSLPVNSCNESSNPSSVASLFVSPLSFVHPPAAAVILGPPPGAPADTQLPPDGSGSPPSDATVVVVPCSPGVSTASPGGTPGTADENDRESKVGVSAKFLTPFLQTAGSSEGNDPPLESGHLSKTAAASAGDASTGGDAGSSGFVDKPMLWPIVGTWFASRWYSMVRSVKRRPLLFGGALLLAVVLVLLGVLLSLTVAVPRIMQSVMNQTSVALLSAVVSDPRPSSARLSIVTLQERPLGTRIILSPLSLQVLYTPKRAHWNPSVVESQFLGQTERLVQHLLAEKEESVPALQARLLLQDFGAEEPQQQSDLVVAGGFNGWRLPPSVSSGASLQRTDVPPQAFPAQQTAAEVHGTDAELIEELEEGTTFELGVIQLPSAELQGCHQQVGLEGALQVTNERVFGAFLRELVTEGAAEWDLRSDDVGVNLFGIRYGGLHFAKTLQLGGPRLHLSSLDADLSDEAQRLEELLTDEEGGDADEQGDALGNAARRGGEADDNLAGGVRGNSSYEDGGAPTTLKQPEEEQPGILLQALDMTQSQPDAAVLHMNVLLDDIVTSGLAVPQPEVTVDPLGRLSLVAFVEGEELLALETLEDAYLSPGAVPLHLVGVLPPMSEGSTPRAAAMQRLFQRLMQGEAAELEVRGLGSSVDLYTPAVQHLLLRTPLQVLGDTELQLVRGLRAGAMKLSFPAEFNGTVMRVQGQLAVAAVNPFGEAAGIALSNGKLEGTLAVKRKKQSLPSLAAPTLAPSPKDDDGANRTGAPATSVDGAVDSDDDDENDLTPIARIAGTLQSNSISTVQRSESGEAQLERVGHLLYTVDALPLELRADIDLSDPEPFRELMVGVMSSPETEVYFLHSAIDVDVECPVGQLHLPAVPLKQPLTLSGLNGMRDIRVTGFNLAQFPLLEVCITPWTADGSVMGVTVEFNSTANVELFLGSLAIELRYQGRPLIYLEARDCSVKPGVNVYDFQGIYRYSEADGSGWMSLGATVLMGRPALVTVTFLDEVPPYYRYQRPPALTSPSPEAAAPEWLRSVLVGMKVDVPLSTSVLLNSGLPPTLTTTMAQAVERRRQRRSSRSTESVAATAAADGGGGDEGTSPGSGDIVNAVQRAFANTARIGVGFLDALSSALLKEDAEGRPAAAAAAATTAVAPQTTALRRVATPSSPASTAAATLLSTLRGVL